MKPRGSVWVHGAEVGSAGPTSVCLSPAFLPYLPFILKIVYLRGRAAQTERQKNLPSDDLLSQMDTMAKASLEAENWEIHPDLSHGLGPFSAIFPRHISREVDQQWSSQDLTCYDIAPTPLLGF